MIWVLDDGPFGVLGRAFNASWTWPESTLWVVREVADGAKKDKSGRRQALLSMLAPSGKPSVAIHDGGRAANELLWRHFRPRALKALRDLGEHASIAVCLAELIEAVFVTTDKGAAYVALSELGRSRVAAPFEVWEWLEQQNLVTIDEYRTLCELTAKQDNGSVVPLHHRR